MNPRDKQELEAVLEYAKQVRDDPRTDPAYAKVLDRWIQRDEQALSIHGAISLTSIVKELNEAQ